MQELVQVEVREEVRVLAVEQVLLRAREIIPVVYPALTPTQALVAVAVVQLEQIPPADHVEQVV